MNKRIRLPAVLLVIPFATTIAQEQAPPLARGVQVTAPALGIEKQEATFDGLEGGALVVTADSTMRCPLAAVTRLDLMAACGSRGQVPGGDVAARAQDAGDLQARFAAQLERLRDDLIEVRRDLHRHPEVSGQEERTAGVVAERLRKLGLTVRTGVGGHGVVALLQGARPGPVVAFRADMDATPSEAPDPVEFRSVTPGVRHICGHDIHTTIGLALAEGLVAVREQLPGSVMLVFQPAEENATGARAMIADGVFREMKPAAIFAYHTAPFNVGQLATALETLMAGRDRVRVTLTGSGDLESAAEEVRSRIESVGTVSPQQAAQPTPPEDFIFAQVGQASQTDVGTVAVEAWITTASSDARAQARRQIENEVAEVRLDGVTVQLDYEERWIAGVTNDAELVRRAVRSASSVVGAEAILMLDIVYPVVSEDFGSFQDLVPGMMLFLGVSNPEKGWVGVPHSPDYVADEESIFVGARVMAAVLLDFLGAR